ncbi:F0F1 ATP synthase subunit epsilon [Sedimentimonas flavescens]|uniref:ATP synthase epsilon chain n=1 Tax=Sedimentimonas flavescens TaxID=2851012 RepID=A0ABT2ZWC8_9RHOB|nr:F0F1 ATP synthase subunit epsilon [Sedimentimonas flavescens]MBW0159050.1 F0F1 ATP synthase subunit epsilon [Sedimentimonas flavescens]MCT2540030.1 F0F1 ATP synthase subunit epsilon [Sedimentimonas flavescens]MCV2878058.1 F0F1 ATP synthase subunit epsilon [Sedimentimonas flavescens]WBL33815.1 F0F1 ATP synthase subunit epsilon [Sinirhodobacter sp. HNIBRBA609]
MADTMQFDLVSPERKLASVQAREVRIPGAEGDLTAMPGHSALITTLRPGILTVVGPEGTAEYAVTGGFAEISAEGVSVLAERGVPKAELTAAIHAEMMAEAKKVVDVAHPSVTDAAVKMLSDMEALGAHINA